VETVLVDTCVWYALFDSRDQYYARAYEEAELFELLTVVVPWPTAYETLRTKFVRKSYELQQFERFLKRPNVEFISDEPFRESAFNISLETSLRRGRPLSMVDCLIRTILDDLDTKINYLATFNRSDFIDVCVSNRVALLFDEIP